ncbi:MAG: hypothetical protein WCW44_06065 [archaeon]|jgi:hypothetical protein
MVEKVPGFLVVPQKSNTSSKLDFDIWMTRGSVSNPFFFTNPSMQEAISRFSSNRFSTDVAAHSTHLGQVSYHSYSDEELIALVGKNGLERINQMRVNDKLMGKPLFVYEFFPFQSHFEKNESSRVYGDQHYFEKKGIALNVERIALRELLKVSPKAMLVPSLWMTDDRMNQLKRRGMKIERSKQVISARQVLQGINHYSKVRKVRARPPSPVQRLGLALKAGKKIRVRR